MSAAAAPAEVCGAAAVNRVSALGTSRQLHGAKSWVTPIRTSEQPADESPMPRAASPAAVERSLALAWFIGPPSETVPCDGLDQEDSARCLF
jgi:hypothetical protein